MQITFRSLGVIALCAMTSIVGAQTYNEAPDLAAKVAAGELPPVEQRLPAHPFVRHVNDTIGRYGGTLHVTNTSEALLDQYPGQGMNGALLSRDQDDIEAGIYPYVAESLESSDDATTWTLRLREGLRWSDGVPLTADDLLFYYQDIIFDTDLNPSPPSWLVVDGKPVEITKLDDLTVQYRFAAPYPFFDLFLFWQGEDTLKFPKHYLEAFHPRYQDEAELQRLMREGGFDSWQQLLEARQSAGSGTSSNILVPGAPTLDPWVLASDPNTPPYVFERNPYFWAVDDEGNQLPYIDRVIADVVQNDETLNLRVLAGQVDLRNVCDISLIPLLKQAEQRGELQAILTESDKASGLDLHFNLTDQDPVLRQVFNDVRFRQAVSLGIDRARIAQLAYLGLVQPTQDGPPEGTEYYDPELKSAFIDYDPDRANALLDEMGLDVRDADGYRLRPDGEALAFNVTSWLPRISADAHELVVDDLKALGLMANMHRPEASEPMEMANTFDAILANAPRSEAWSFAVGSAGPWVPLARNASGPYPAMWAGQYAVWAASDGQVGEEPPQLLKDIVSDYKALQVEADAGKRAELADAIFSAAAENLWAIGIVTDRGCTTVATPNLRNVPHMTYFYRNAVEPEQLWFDDNP